MLVRDKIDYNKKIVRALISLSIASAIVNTFFLITGGFGELAFDSLSKYTIFFGLVIGGGMILGYLLSILICLSVVIIYQIIKFIVLLVKRLPLKSMIPNKDSWIVLRDFTLLVFDTEHYKRC